MRIHYLSSSTIISDSANSVHVMKMCEAFAANGHEVTLSALKGDGSDIEAFRYYGVRQHFHLLRHDEWQHRIVGTMWLLRQRVPRMRVGGLPSLVYGRVAIAPNLRRDSPDLVYARNPYWLAGISRNLPFVSESHKPPGNAFDRLVEARVYQRKGFRQLVVISEKLKELYLSIFPDLSGRIIVAHDAADDPGASLHMSNCNTGRFHIGYVGHLYAGRGTEIIRQAAGALPEAVFHIVGGTKEDQARFAASGLAPNVILHGHHPPSRLADFYRRFNAVLAPYQRQVSIRGSGNTAAFMSPLKIFEYMSWGRPILCSDMPVLREVLEDGRNAILLPPDDAEAWVTALRHLMNDAIQCQQLGDAARADFLARHTWRARAKRVLDNIEAPQVQRHPESSAEAVH